MAGKPLTIVVGDGSATGVDAARKPAADGYDIAVLCSSGKGETLAQIDGGIARSA